MLTKHFEDLLSKIRVVEVKNFVRIFRRQRTWIRGRKGEARGSLENQAIILVLHLGWSVEVETPNELGSEAAQTPNVD